MSLTLLNTDKMLNLQSLNHYLDDNWHNFHLLNPNLVNQPWRVCFSAFELLALKLAYKGNVWPCSNIYIFVSTKGCPELKTAPSWFHVMATRRCVTWWCFSIQQSKRLAPDAKLAKFRHTHTQSNNFFNESEVNVDASDYFTLFHLCALMRCVCINDL